ncbi:pilus assembly protein [Paenibacillus graminis]|uniref:pilus assembly protein n=1 Tax=Paenibacillus graminis TaxID=189425 RepID=UPI002DB73BAE|nr:pilus assembly protein [Paenibacillus graminis]MEC0171670.1 pilus assembly protein [Paenibacillus graminis]
MKKKVVLTGALTLALAATGAVAWASPSTIQTNAYTPESSVVASQPADTTITNPLSEDGTITPMLVDDTWEDTAYNGTANVSLPFNVNPGYGHLKLLLQNFSGQQVHITLTHVESGLVYINEDISNSKEWKSWEKGHAQGMRSGNYILSWSGNSTVVNGKYFGKTASSTSDF